MIESVTLSNSDLRVSRVAFGAEPLGGTDWGPVSTSEVAGAARAAWEDGINFFDTADVYGLGRSEERLAAALGPHRHEAVIATKFGLRWESHGGERARICRDASAGYVTRAVEASLRRLRLEAIPLYFVHWPDPATPLAETFAALASCQQAGKVRHVGVSNFSADQIREAHGLLPLAAVQLPYSLIQREVEINVLPCCEELGISVLAYGPLAQGLLTGKVRESTTFGTDDRRHRLPHFQRDARRSHLETVERVAAIARRHGRSAAQVAARWVLDSPAIACAIVGARSAAQVAANSGAMGWKLDEANYRMLAEETSHERV
jgi:aryl-alcohol dehydrogenase-like predicted oxidoreductase